MQKDTSSLYAQHKRNEQIDHFDEMPLQVSNMIEEEDELAEKLHQMQKQNRDLKSQMGPVPTKNKITHLEVDEFFYENLPTSPFYEKSFMHKEIINLIVTAPKAGCLITCSTDGVLKFWEKSFKLIEFIRQFQAHKGLITSISLNYSQTRLVTCSPVDSTIKVFDVLNYDMINLISLDSQPVKYISFIYRGLTESLHIAGSAPNSGEVFIFNEDGEPIKDESNNKVVCSLHKTSICAMKFNYAFGTVISTDEAGFIEYWDPSTLGKISIFLFILIFKDTLNTNHSLSSLNFLLIYSPWLRERLKPYLWRSASLESSLLS